MAHLSNRKYCSESCGSKARYARKHPDYATLRALFDPALRQRALELYWGGLDRMSIAGHLGTPVGTVDSWVHYFGGLRERQRTPEAMELMPLRRQVRYADSAEEWAQIFREAAGCFDATETNMVRLVCGAVNGQGEVNILATIIADRLKTDPCNGEVFAFCDIAHDTVTTIQWRNGTFRLTMIHKRRGERYLWPAKELGLSVTLTARAFEYLLSCRKTRSRYAEKS